MLSFSTTSLDSLILYPPLTTYRTLLSMTSRRPRNRVCAPPAFSFSFFPGTFPLHSYVNWKKLTSFALFLLLQPFSQFLVCDSVMPDGILPSFLGALQASLTVLLTISYGGIASRFNLLKESSARDISKVCVRLFLPALLITNVGNELHLDTASKYIPVLGELNK